jgi:hypothetical protein
MKIIEIKPREEIRRCLRRGSAGRCHAFRARPANSMLDYARNCRFGGTSGEIRVYDEAGENVIDVIPVQGQRAFGA